MVEAPTNEPVRSTYFPNVGSHVFYTNEDGVLESESNDLSERLSNDIDLIMEGKITMSHRDTRSYASVALALAQPKAVKEHKNKDADEDDLKNNLDLVRIEDTPRFKFFNDMRQEEIEFFDMHGASIGNIIKYRSILLQRAKAEIDRINKIYNNDNLGSEVRDKLITQPNDNMLSHLRSIKFNKDINFNNTITS